MVSYEKLTLDNGLRVLLHRDDTTPLVTINIMYCVGARDESEIRTGFAHLFEHIMYGGTRLYPDYDQVVDQLGGESNAFTNNDYTNYYLTLPAQYLEQALRLEADRMNGDWEIEGDHWHVLEVQQRVVTEEYNQRYMNQPYGDVWLLLRPLCYKVHPYRWNTIGADIRHVQEATLQDVRNFYDRYYLPSNAILAIAGNLDIPQTKELVRRIFGAIAHTSALPRQDSNLLTEPIQTSARRKEVLRNVPNNAIYKAWVMCDRWSPDYYVYDILSDILSNGHSSRMYQHLVQEQGLFTEINAYITGNLGPGLFVISGRLCDNVDFEQAEMAIDEEIKRIQHEPISSHELEKVANKFENTFVYSQLKTSDRALNLCYFEMIGQPNLINREPEYYRKITPSDIQRVAKNLRSENSNTLLIKRDCSTPTTQ